MQRSLGGAAGPAAVLVGALFHQLLGCRGIVFLGHGLDSSKPPGLVPAPVGDCVALGGPGGPPVQETQVRGRGRAVRLVPGVSGKRARRPWVGPWRGPRACSDGRGCVGLLVPDSAPAGQDQNACEHLHASRVHGCHGIPAHAPREKSAGLPLRMGQEYRIFLP